MGPTPAEERNEEGAEDEEGKAISKEKAWKEKEMLWLLKKEKEYLKEK